MSRFLARNTNMFTFSGFNKLRSGVATLPAVLNTRSDGALVAQIHKYLSASLAMSGNPPWLFFHPVRGFSSPSTVVVVAGLFQRKLPSELFFFLGTVPAPDSSSSLTCAGPCSNIHTIRTYQGCNGTQKSRFGTYFGFQVTVRFIFGTVRKQNARYKCATLLLLTIGILDNTKKCRNKNK